MYFPSSSTYDIYSAQDEGHIENIQRVCADFETCFPNLTIRVKIDYDKIDSLEYPVSCLVIHSTKRIDQFVSSEIYVKQLNHASTSYNDLYMTSKVFAMKNSGLNKPKLYKAQTFDGPSNIWLKSPNIELVFKEFYSRNLAGDEYDV